MQTRTFRKRTSMKKRKEGRKEKIKQPAAAKVVYIKRAGGGMSRERKEIK